MEVKDIKPVLQKWLIEEDRANRDFYNFAFNFKENEPKPDFTQFVINHTDFVIRAKAKAYIAHIVLRAFDNGVTVDGNWIANRMHQISLNMGEPRVNVRDAIKDIYDKYCLRVLGEVLDMFTY